MKHNRGPSLQQTEIRLVFDLIKLGCRTSNDIAGATNDNITIHAASAYLSRLEKRGKIRRTGGLVRYHINSRGSIQWKPMKK
jgi:DNA-binding MarR family transcriptional regulator